MIIEKIKDKIQKGKMKCIFCGGELEKKIVTFYYEENNKCLLVENVPAQVCTKCGEKTFSPKVTDELLNFARDKFKPVKSINIPVFDFAKKALAS